MNAAEIIVAQACRDVISMIQTGRRIGHAASMWACAKEPWRCRRFGHRYPLYWGQLSDVERLPEWRCLRRRCPYKGGRDRRALGRRRGDVMSNGSEHLPEHAPADAGSALDVDGIAAVLAEALTNEGGGPGNSIHSWRCEHPDRYGDCTCVQEVATIQAEAVAAHVEAQREADRAADLTDDELARCIADPGSVVGSKDRDETVTRWGVRAIRHMLAEAGS